MKKFLLPLLTALVGGGIGVLATRTYFDKLYRKREDEAVASVKAVFARHGKAAEGKPDEERPADPLKAYAQEEIDPEEVVSMPKRAERRRPYVIRPEEFGMRDGYETLTFYAFADGTLADDGERRMNAKRVAETVGMDAVNHFGEYEDDSVFVRNERLHTDYEIIRDERPYEELLDDKPYLREEDE